MVIDWKRQIDECIRQNRIMPIFNGRPSAYAYEHLLIVKRLVEKGYDDSQILNWMTVAGSDLVISVEAVEDLRRTVMIRKNWPKEHDFTIYVTKGELDYIEALEATKEQKSYLLAYVCYLKLMRCRTKRNVLKPRQEAFIYYLAFGDDNYKHGKDRRRFIQPFMRKLFGRKVLTYASKTVRYTRYAETGPLFEEISYTGVNAKWVDWDAKEGEGCIRIDNPEFEIKDLASRAFSENIRICECCGKEFPYDGYTKRNICEDCWLKQEELRKHGPRKEAKTMICECCGKTFVKDVKSHKRICDDCQAKKEAIRLHSPRKEAKTVICENCGKTFVRMGDGKRGLCEECYKKARRETIKLAVRQYRAAKRCKQQSGGQSGEETPLDTILNKGDE